MTLCRLNRVGRVCLTRLTAVRTNHQDAQLSPALKDQYYPKLGLYYHFMLSLVIFYEAKASLTRGIV